MPKASLAIAIIAKNAAKTIGACLDSIVPYVEQVVVAVDALTTDDTAAIAAKHGAKVHLGLHVSETHECPDHGQILAQHFAKARQQSFAYLRKDVAFWGWLDADDILHGGEKLAAYLGGLPGEVDGVWLAYHYSTAGDGGPTSTLFDRERFVRTDREWAWQYRVHEILAPVGTTTESLTWTRTDEIGVWHQGQGHDTAGSARRNITLLEIDLEENANDMRAWFYLGNQYFALQDWGPAIECYERSTQAENPYQLWQSLIYLSMAYEKIGDLDNSRQAAFHALDIQPQHPEPYYRLAICYMLAGDLPRCKFWTDLGDKMPDPPFFVFRNPLDRPFNARLTLAQAYAMQGESSKARQQLEIAARTLQTKEVLEGIAYHKQLEEDCQDADAFLRLRHPATLVASMIASHGPYYPYLDRESVPESMWKFGRVRDDVVPQILHDRQEGDQPRIVFFCGRSAEPWAPPSINTTGIGGSETAVIQIAKRFAADGYRVDVYNDCDKFEGVYDGVGYWDLKRFQEGEATDIYVSWRNPAGYQLPIQRRVSLLWCHDLNKGAGQADAHRQWDKVLGVSPWHRDYLSQVYGLDNVSYVPNGIDLERFSQTVKKVPFQCCYTSSPDRGLERLLELWPRIVANEPGAKLMIAYGWDTIDKYIAMGHQPLAAFKAHINQMIERTPNVVWLGRLAQDSLAHLYQESYAWLYPSDFTETFCIACVESMAAGCVPVASGVGALPSTIGDGGCVVKGNVYTRSWRDYYIAVLKGVLHAPDIRKHYARAGLERAKGYSWDASFSDHWKPLVTALLEGKKEEADAICA